MPATARRFGVSDAFDPRQNILGGVRYLRALLDMFDGDTMLAAAAYNAGENAVRRYRGVPPYAETRAYVRKVHALLGSSGAAAPETASRRPAVTTAADAGAERTGARARKPRTLYRWVDADGTPHLADTPPAGRSDYVTIRSTD